MTPRPRIALTLGDPAGIGGELGAKLLATPGVTHGVDVTVVATPDEIDRAAAQAHVTLDLSKDHGEGKPVLSIPEHAIPLPTALAQVSEHAGQWALDSLRHALALQTAAQVDAICFAPLNKTSLHMAGLTEPDELHWLANELDHPDTISELNVLDGLWTARATSHTALANVAPRITATKVTDVIGLLHSALRHAGSVSPRIAVAALNPHAGDNGAFGREEIDVITPAIQAARDTGIDVSGPHPSDTIFLTARHHGFDGVVTMYHDQGQVAMKLMGFDRGVTVQGGLPIPITTPAHGSAFDIVGSGEANTQATINAFHLAASMTRQPPHEKPAPTTAS